MENAGCRSTVLIETDNMAAKGAASKFASSSEDMQELVRRLLEYAELFELTLRFVHTPGELLHRPDQTSRGDAVEEPRARLVRKELRAVLARHGPFAEYIGTERQYAEGNTRGGLFVHPSYNTVGSALRLIGERLAGPNGEEVRGAVVVPWAPSAKWWQMLNHFSVEGFYPEGGGHLEINQMGRWVGVRARRPSLLLSFPRGAGARVLQVQTEQDFAGTAPAGYVSVAGCNGLCLPVLSGAVLYSPSGHPGRESGCLYLSFGLNDPRGEEASIEDGEWQLGVAELLAVEGRAGEYTLSFKRNTWKAYNSGRAVEGSFAPRPTRKRPEGGDPLWPVSGRILWTVNHLVERLIWDPSALDGDGSFEQDKLERVRFRFDPRVAEAEIARACAANETDGGLSPPAEEGQVSWQADDESESAASDSEAHTQAKRGAEIDAQDELAAVAAEKELAAAQAQAQRSATLRRQPTPPPRTKAKSTAAPADAPRHQLNRYPDAKCEGCGGDIRFGAKVVAVGRGLCHMAPACRQLAEAALDKRAADRKVAKRVQDPVEDMTRRLQCVRVGHEMGEERLRLAWRCLDGRCGVSNEEEPRLFCSEGCGRGLHLVRCLGQSAHRAATQGLKCAVCWAAEITSDEPTPGIKSTAMRGSLLQLSTGKVGTHSGYAEYERLESKWASEVSGGRMSAVTLPRNSKAAFISFIDWLTSDGERARSFATLMRSASGLMVQLKLQDWTKDRSVKAIFKELERSRGIESEPCTLATARMIQIMRTRTIAEVSRSPLIQSRVKGQMGFELVGGVRLGEAVGADGGHGLFANDVCVQQCRHEEAALQETIEFRVESSKTILGRTVVAVGTTQNLRYPFARDLKEYWQTWGVETSQYQDGAFTITRPDYWVVRVSLVDMSKSRQQRLIELLARSTVESLRKNAAASRMYIDRLARATKIDQERRFVNVCGGAKRSADVIEAKRWLDEHGFGSWADVVKGPLFRAMHGAMPSHMPLQPDSCYKDMVAALKRAGELTLERHRAGDVDTELERNAIDNAEGGYRWSSHSLRRYADSVARRHLGKLTEAGVAKPCELIDYYFGWKLREMMKDMQLHYANEDRGGRLSLARVTMMM